MKISNVADLLIVNDVDQLLLASRSKAGVGENLWSVPGGNAEIGENFEEALVREIKEELDCEIDWYKYFRSYYFQVNDDLAVRANYYYGKVLGEPKPLPEELAEVKWFDIEGDELQNLDYAFNQREVVKDFVSFWVQDNM